MVRSEAATEAPVKQFQEIQTLVVDGQVGPNTQATLCSELQNLTVESGVGEFWEWEKRLKPSGNQVPQNAEEEDLRQIWTS